MTIDFPTTLLTNRAIIRASGQDALALLQGLLTCDVVRLEPGSLAYGFLLTPQGRFLHELFILKQSDYTLLDVQSQHVEGFLKRLKLYTLKSDARFELQDHWGVIAAKRIDALPAPCIAVSDPRHKELGTRIYGPDAELTATAHDTAIEGYDAHRIRLGIPAAEDFIAEKTLLLDYDVDQLGGVDFDKGCYVGQEVTARMHYRGINKKGIYLVTAADEKQMLPPKHTDITADGKKAGMMLSAAGQQGMALLRHEYKNGILVADGVSIHVTRPEWVNLRNA